MVKKNMRRSCAVPGIKRSSLGNLRSIAICLAPSDLLPDSLPSLAGSLALGRNFFKMAMRPVEGPPMVNLPMRVNCITGGADITQTIASQSSLRAFSASMTGR